MNPKLFSFSAQETECEKIFAKSGPFWHIATNGNEMEIIFTNDDDFRFATNSLAISLMESRIKLIAFAIMNNHIHLLTAGLKDDCLMFFEIYKARLKLYFSRKGVKYDWSRFTCGNLIPITSINMIRNEIAYIHRNAYAAKADTTPYSYLWSSDYSYFKVPLKFESTLISKIPARDRREIFHMKNTIFPIDYHISNNLILSEDFCDIELGMAMFRDANQYFYKISKSYEAYSECAKRLGEKILVTDDDLFSIMVGICKSKYFKESVNLLAPNEKLEIARILHSEYNAQNNQIRRMLKIDSNIINEMFGK